MGTGPLVDGASGGVDASTTSDSGGAFDASDREAGPGDAGDAAAPACSHTAFPPVSEANTFLLSHLQLVTITYPGYEFRSQVEAFGAFLPRSS